MLPREVARLCGIRHMPLGNEGRSSEGLGGPLWSFQNYVYLFVPGIGHVEVRGQPTEIDFLLLPSGP